MQLFEFNQIHVFVLSPGQYLTLTTVIVVGSFYMYSLYLSPR